MCTCHQAWGSILPPPPCPEHGGRTSSWTYSPVVAEYTSTTTTYEVPIPVTRRRTRLERADDWCHRHLPEWSFRWLCNWHEARATGRHYGAK